MRILFVCSKNSGRVVPFIEEQAESVRRLGHTVDFFTIEGKGIGGYLKNWLPYIAKLRTFQPDVVHAHYGLSCLFANLQRIVPVVSTYHGSDINDPKVFRFSKIAIKLSRRNVFVSEKITPLTPLETSPPAPLLEERGEREGRWKNVVIPCGVDTALFVPMDKQECRERMKLEADKKYVLFAGAFENKVKNAVLAKAAVGLLEHVEILELKGYSRQEVVWLMNAVDAVLMTSFTEGSPQFIKEAMACNCPVVSVPVGDVAELISCVDGCLVVDDDATLIANALQLVLNAPTRTFGRVEIEKKQLDIRQVAERIVTLYQSLIK